MRDCVCCCEAYNTSEVRVCDNDHAVCTACARRLGRADCIICLPFAPAAPAPACGAHVGRDVAVGVLSIVLASLQLAAAFLAAVYAGKVCLWLYTLVSPQTDAWFGWARFQYCLWEALIGMLVLGILNPRVDAVGSSCRRVWSSLE